MHQPSLLLCVSLLVEKGYGKGVEKVRNRCGIGHTIGSGKFIDYYMYIHPWNSYFHWLCFRLPRRPPVCWILQDCSCSPPITISPEHLHCFPRSPLISHVPNGYEPPALTNSPIDHPAFGPATLTTLGSSSIFPPVALSCNHVSPSSASIPAPETAPTPS